LLEGLDSGDSTLVDAEFWSVLRKEALEVLESRKNRSSGGK
jgi:hypothetical protein